MEHETSLTYPEFTLDMAKINIFWYPIFTALFVTVLAIVNVVNASQKAFFRSSNPLVSNTAETVASVFLILLFGGIQWVASLPFNLFFFFASKYSIKNHSDFYEEWWIVLFSMISTVGLALTGFIGVILSAITHNTTGIAYGEFAVIQWVLAMTGSVPYSTLVVYDNIFN